MDNKKKMAVIGLIILTLILGGASIFLSQYLQNTQAPAESNASGFGSAVNRDYFDDFASAFTTYGCYSLFSDSAVNAYAPDGFDQITKYTYTIQNKEPQNKIPLDCNISLSNSLKQIELVVHTYDENSGIDPTAEALFLRINANIANIEEKAINSDIAYFYGTDSTDLTSCRLNFFSLRNDFEYVTIAYKNFNQNCSELKNFNTEVVYILNKTINNLIDFVVDNPISYTK